MTSERLREIARIMACSGPDFTSEVEQRAARDLFALADEFDKVSRPGTEERMPDQLPDPRILTRGAREGK